MTAIRHIVYECVPGAYAGGVQKMVYELAFAQRQLGADVEVWAPDAIRAGSTEDFEGLPIRYFYPEPLFGLARSRRLGRAVLNLPVGSVVHAHNSFHPLDLQVGRAARSSGLRAYYHTHGAFDPVLFSGQSFKSLKKRIHLRFFTRPNLNAGAGIFALTSFERDQLALLGIDKRVHVIPNGIRPVQAASLAAGQGLRAKHGIPSEASAILFVGRITPKKRLEHIIEAVSILGAAAPHLLIAGCPKVEPLYAAELTRCALRHGVSGQIHWLGFLDEQAKAAAYVAADIFVHASESEGMALAILEAMDAGLPVVATRGCYMSDAAASAALVECEQGAAALAKALAPLVSDPHRAHVQGTAGRAYVRKEHAWSAIAAETLKIYAEGASPS